MEGLTGKQNKIWVCNRCRNVFTTRWLLARHLKQVHKIASKEANHEAMLCEWWRVYNPRLSDIGKGEE